MSYNGWTNYETWAVNLWLTNEKGSDAWLRESAQECWNEANADSTFSREERAALNLADQIKDLLEEGNPITDASVFSDLLNAALSTVNWREIAENHLDDVEKVTRAELGSVSSGTLRTEDLIPAFEAVLDTFSIEYDRPIAADKLLAGGDLTEEELDDVDYYLNEDLFGLLGDIAPEGHYFGAHPGDGADFGFWPND